MQPTYHESHNVSNPTMDDLYCRLTPPYMLLVLVWLALSRYFANGPMWLQDGFNTANACKKMWWVNLLYINNFVKPEDFDVILDT